MPGWIEVLAEFRCTNARNGCANPDHIDGFMIAVDLSRRLIL